MLNIAYQNLRKGRFLKSFCTKVYQFLNFD